MQLPKNLILRGFLSAAGAVLYIFGIATIFFNETLFSNGPLFLGPVLVLMLLVFSVAVMGVLFFLGPIWLYLENRKTDALKLLAWIFGWFFLFAVLVSLVVAIWGRFAPAGEI